MSKSYDTMIRTYTKGKIDAYSICHVLEKEMEDLLGGSDRYIMDGMIHEEDYRSRFSEIIRQATPNEIEVYNALQISIRHFKGL